MTTQPSPQHVGRLIFANLARRRQRGDLPRCPTCSHTPERIDLVGDTDEHVLLFQPCGHTITA